jgi:polysaccharide biosynthesis transport protein
MNLQRGQSAPTPRRRKDDVAPGMPRPVNGAVAAGNDDRPFFRLHLRRALQLHRRLAMGIALAGLVLALAYVALTWPVYTAQSRIYIQPVQSKLMTQDNDQGGSINPAAYDSFVQQQVQSASNPEVLVNALHKLGPGAWQKSDESEQAAADRLGRSIEVVRAGTSYEVTITARARDPQLSAQIANAVASSIVERASGEGNAGDAERITVLRAERDRIQSELNSDYAEQDALNKQLGMAAVGTAAPDLIDNDIGKIREELIKAQTEHDQAEARFTAMKAGQGSSSAAIDAESDDMVAADPGLTSMKTSLNQRRAVLITQMANMTPNNPAYKQNAAELAKINSTLDSMMKELRASAALRIQQKLRTDLERTAGVETQLNGQLRQLAETAASATPKLQRVNDLATDIVRLRARFSSVDEQLHNLMLEDSAPGAVHLSVTAVAPLHPTISGILKKALPLALGGLVLGLLAASIANQLDSKIYIAADIERVLGYAPMAVLPDFDEVSDEVAAEHLLRLSAAIEHARKQGTLRSCIFTGTGSGTGVTTVVTRVRDILEAMGRPTVLLDASGTPPPAPRASGAATGMESASGQPATQTGSRSTALLQRVAAETEMQRESLVLTDTAPLAISAETEYLARFVDCAIVVVESGVTTRAQLLGSLNTLQRLEVAAVGVVLNRVGLAKADPEFRNSVREIEKHLQAQSLSASRRAMESRLYGEEPLPEAESVHKETTTRASLAPEVREPAPEPEMRRPSPEVPLSVELAQEPKAVAEELRHPEPAPLQSQPAPSVNSEVPWWLLDSTPETITKYPLSAKARESARVAPSEPELESETSSAWSWEDSRSWRGGFAREVVPGAAPEARAEIAEKVAPQETPQFDAEKNPYETQSRLNSLRGVLFSLGLKNLSKSRGTAQADDEFSQPMESKPEHTVLVRRFPPFGEPDPVFAAPAKAEVAIGPASPVIAEPEFLPPREFVPIKDREPSQETGSSPRYDLLDEDDDIQTLPSRRGQYKRRN